MGENHEERRKSIQETKEGTLIGSEIRSYIDEIDEKKEKRLLQ